MQTITALSKELARRIGQSLTVGAWAGIVAFGMHCDPASAGLAGMAGVIAGAVMPHRSARQET